MPTGDRSAASDGRVHRCELSHAHRLAPPVRHRDRVRARASATSWSVGTHECDYPPEVVEVPVVTGRPDARIGDTSREIHDRVSDALHGGSSIYHLDPTRSRELGRTSSSPRSCARSARSAYREVSAAVRALDGEHDGREPGAALDRGHPQHASRRWARSRRPRTRRSGLIELLRERLAAIENRVLERRLAGDRRRAGSSCSSGSIRPSRRVTGCPRWCAARVAGSCWVGRGSASVETTWDRVREVDPEQLILAPCGFERGRGAHEVWDDRGAAGLVRRLRAVRDGELFAVDGAGSCHAPGRGSSTASRCWRSCSTPRAWPASRRPGSWIPLGPIAIGPDRSLDSSASRDALPQSTFDCLWCGRAWRATGRRT